MISIQYHLDHIQVAANQIIVHSGDEKVWVFQGQMGAGKTTLIKALSKEFNVLDQVSSPTFGIVNEYDTITGQHIFHFDFYRMDDPSEALDIGIEEYFYSGKYCWIEWAENIAQFLPEEFLLIKIVVDSEKERTLTLQHTKDVN